MDVSLDVRFPPTPSHSTDFGKAGWGFWDPVVDLFMVAGCSMDGENHGIGSAGHQGPQGVAIPGLEFMC